MGESQQLAPPSRYFPVEGGIYQVTAGLKNLGVDFGNGAADARLVQIDDGFAEYRENKLACRAERVGKYFATHEFSDEVQSRACKVLIGALCQEYPAQFSWVQLDSAKAKLECRLTGETLFFNEYRLVDAVCAPSVQPKYLSGFDALVSQIPEDVAVVRRNEQKDWLAAIHLCAPGHWAAEQKIGKDFTNVHAPVPHISPITKAARAMVHAMIQKGPFVRFVWGFGSDNRLNHHPDPAPGWDLATWKGRSFQSVPEGECPFYLRLERQVTYGMPEVEAALFFIRVYYIDGREIRKNPEERDRLSMALRTMDADSRRYKGLTESVEPLLEWLNA